MGVFALHVGDVAGVGWNLASALTGLGYPSTAISLAPSPEGFTTDLTLDMTPGIQYPMRVVNAAKLLWMASRSKLVHFHFGFPRFARTIRRACSSPFFVHFHGSDLREHLADDNRDLAVKEFVSTPDLRSYAPSATWIPNPVTVPGAMTDSITRRNSGQEVPVVGHFPTNARRKGTAEIMAGIDSLRSEMKIDLRIMSGVGHAQALLAMSECDIVVDQLTSYGVYGNVAVEAMLLGKVVMSSINPSLYDRCPAIPITKTDFVTRLRDLLEHRDCWQEYGVAGREYAKRVHDPKRVARLLLNAYQAYI